MIHYRDMTFCPGEGCKDFNTCPRALTTEVLDAADRWWNKGYRAAPIARYIEPKECFIMIHEGKHYDYRSAVHNGLVGMGAQLKEVIRDNNSSE